MSSNGNNNHLTELYMKNTNSIFATENLDNGLWDKICSKDMRAEMGGQQLDSAGFFNAVNGMKGAFAKVSIEYIECIVNGRTVGSVENVKLEKADGTINHAKAIISATYGEEGTRDAERLVRFVEIVQFM
jgi:hypothetical protein